MKKKKKKKYLLKPPVCPTCLIFFNWPGSSPPSCITLQFEKKVIRTEVIEKNNNLP